MSGFGDAMNDAFEGLRRAEACDGHKWRKPRRTIRSDGFGRHKREVETYETMCVKCGLRASRPTLERLKVEVIEKSR